MNNTSETSTSGAGCSAPALNRNRSHSTGEELPNQPKHCDDGSDGELRKAKQPHMKLLERRSQKMDERFHHPKSFGAQEVPAEVSRRSLTDDFALAGAFFTRNDRDKNKEKGSLSHQSSVDIQGQDEDIVAPGAYSVLVHGGAAVWDSHLAMTTSSRNRSVAACSVEPGVIVAEPVDSEPGDKKEIISSFAVEESFWILLRHHKRTQIIAGCLLFAVIALVIGLVASLSRKSPSQPTSKVRERLGAYATIDGSDIRGEFGSSLSFSADATRLAIGAPGSDGGAGSVEVYEEQGDGSSLVWELFGGRLVGNTTSDRLGAALSLSRDGRTLATCAPGGSGTIAVYSFSLVLGEWVRIGDPITGIVCRSVSLSGDGELFAVAGVDSVSGEGVISIFEILGGQWTLIGSFSGHTATLSANRRRVAIGSESNMTMGTPATLSVFEFASVGTWTKLGSAVNGDISLYDHGWLTACSDDGSIVAVGGYFVDPETRLDISHPKATVSALSAKAYRFADGDWSQVGQTLHQYVEGAHSVYPVSLSANGDVLAIGDPGKVVGRDGNSGHAHVARLMERNSNNGDDEEEWVHIAADVDGEAAGDQFGKAVVLSPGGGLVAVGAPFNRGDGYEHGRVQVFDFKDVASAGSF